MRSFIQSCTLPIDPLRPLLLRFEILSGYTIHILYFAGVSICLLGFWPRGQNQRPARATTKNCNFACIACVFFIFAHCAAFLVLSMKVNYGVNSWTKCSSRRVVETSRRVVSITYKSITRILFSDSSTRRVALQLVVSHFNSYGVNSWTQFSSRRVVVSSRRVVESSRRVVLFNVLSHCTITRLFFNSSCRLSTRQERHGSSHIEH